MDKLLIIQPLLSQYRIDVYNELGRVYEVYVLSSDIDASSGCGSAEIENTHIKQHIVEPVCDFFRGKLIYQSHLIKHIKKLKPDKIFTYANLRCISYWILLFYCWFHKIPVYSHTQGPYNKSKSFAYKVIYFLMSKLSTKTLLYTPYSLQKIEELGLSKEQFCVIHNSIVNKYPVLPETKEYSNKGILFIGRLRKGCNLELLCDTIIKFKNENPLIEGHIIGSGELDKFYIEKYKTCEYITFYGMVYDQNKIAEISKKCIIGCYPGNAGLSIVHYMSLSLPCLVHDNIAEHQGPEPSYLKDKYNGRLFRCEDKENFERVIKEMMVNTNILRAYGNNAYKTYIEITKPSYAQRMINVLEEK
jgi:glycosyltransferase involved in cell wall biosynthesis